MSKTSKTENLNIQKYSCVKGLELTAGDLELINRQSLRPLTAEDVFTFKVRACDDQVDREFENFSLSALGQLAELFVGKTFIFDHLWSASNQTARVYAADVENEGGVNSLIVRAYMLRNEDTAPIIRSIEGGILREVSVCVGVKSAVCSICGINKRKARCEHRPGQEYDGKLCTVELGDICDAYELSFVAVPAQREAGVVKTYGGEDEQPEAAKSTSKSLSVRIRLAEKIIKNFEEGTNE